MFSAISKSPITPGLHPRGQIRARTYLREQNARAGGLALANRDLLGNLTATHARVASFHLDSSMGRLTLNVLLSFAQFERELTGERIRDKIAASKKKGSSGFKLTLRLPTSPDDSSDALTLERLVPITMKRRGVELRLIIQNEPPSRAKVDLVLLKTIARAHKWFDQLVSGEVKSLAAIAAREGLNYRFVG